MIRKFTRLVGGRSIEVTLDTDDLEPGADLVSEAGSVAGQIGLVGELLGVVTEQIEVADAGYRNWRAAEMSRVIARDPKLAEWKVKASIESKSDFMDHKRRIASVSGDLEFLRSYHLALKTKASMIRGRIELERGERDGTSLGVDARDESMSQPIGRMDRVRSTMKKGRK